MISKRSTGGWKIWITYYDHDRRVVGYGVYTKEYTRRDAAVRRAKQMFGDNPCMSWIVSQTDPHEMWRG